MQETAVLRPHALANRTFRGLLLLLAGIPIVGTYVWRALLQPIAFGTEIGDFRESYMRAASRLAANSDPYDLCRQVGCLEPTGPQYVMPPLLAWILQPLVGVNSHVADIVVIVALNASLAVFLFCALRVLRVYDVQLAVLLVLVALAFEPVMGNIDEGQVNLVLLALSGVWLWGWVAGRWWGGLALGATVAIKLIQGPVAVLVLWARRWSMLAAAAVAGLALWLVATPQYLFEYLTSVLPAVSGGTGFFENHSPGGTIARFLRPDTFLGPERGSPLAARLITVAIALAALAITLIVLRTPATKWSGRTLEAAAIVAVAPLIASYSWGTHLVLLLLPMFVLIAWSVRRRDWVVLGLVIASWLLISPAHKAFQVVLLSHYSNIVVLRLMAEFGVIGIAAIWIASLIAVRRERSKPS
jgi:hypothetical protein